MDKAFYLERVENDPSDIASVRALGEIALAEGQWAEAAKRLKDEATFLHKGSERSSLFHTGALLHYKKLSNPEEALNLVTRAIDSHNEYIPAIHLKRTLLAKLGKWEELAEILLEEATLLSQSSPSLSNTLHLIRSRVLLHKLSKPEDALSAIKEAGDFPPALEALEEYYLQRSEWEELVGTLLRLHDAATDTAFKAALSMKAAFYLENMIKDINRARAQYGTALEEIEECSIKLPADEVAARASLAEMATRALEPLEAADHITKIIELDRTQTGGPYQAAIRQKAAKDFLKGKANELALKHLMEARNIAPDDLRILGDIDFLTRAIDHAACVENLECSLKVEADPVRKAALLIQKGRIEMHLLGKPEQGVASLLDATRLIPDDVHALAQLASGFREIGRWEELVPTMHDIVSKTGSDDKLKAALTTTLSNLIMEKLFDASAAREALIDAIQLPPTSLTGLMMLEGMESALKAHDRLAGLLDAQAKIVTDKEYLKHLHLKSAFLWWEMLGKDDMAFKALAQAIAIDPNSPEAIGVIKIISARQESWANLESAIQRELEAEKTKEEPDQKRVAFYLDALARLAIVIRHDPKESEKLFIEALEILGEDIFTRLELASLAYSRADFSAYAEQTGKLSEALEGTSWSVSYRHACAACASADKEAAIRAMDTILSAEVSNPALLSISLDLNFLGGNWAHTLQCMTSLGELMDDSSRPAIMRKMGHVHLTRLEDFKAAANCFGHAVGLDAEDVSSMESLRSLHAEEGDHESEVKALGMIVSLEESSARIAAIKSEISSINESVDDYHGATRALEEAYSTDGENLELIRRLEWCYEKTGELEKAAGLVAKEIGLRDDERLKISLNLKLAGLEEKQEKLADAAQAYEAAVAFQPTIIKALERLVEIYEKLENWGKLSDALKRKADLNTDAADKLGDLMYRARVLETRLNNADGALETLRESHALDPDSLTVLMEIERLSEAAELFEELDEVLSKQAELNKENDILLRIYLKQGGVRDLKLDRLEPSIESYRKALEKDGENIEAVTALESLYERTSQNNELIEMLELRAGIIPEEAASLHIRVAKIWEERLQNKEEAVSSLYKAVEAESNNLTAIDGLIRLTGELGELHPKRWEELDKILAKKASVVPEEQSISCHIERSKVLKEKLNNPEEALDALDSALQINPKHNDALTGAARICQELEKWEEAIGFLGRQVELLPMEERPSVLTRMGLIAENELRNDARASRHFEDTLLIDGTYADAFRPLADIYFRHSKWQKAEPLLEKWNDSFKVENFQNAPSENAPSENAPSVAEETPELKAQVYFKMGRTVAQLNREDEALQWLDKAIREDPNLLVAAGEMLQLRLKREELEQAKTAGECLLKAAKGLDKADETFFAFKTLAEIEEKLSRPEDAVKRYLEALSVRGNDVPIMENLIRLYDSLEQHEAEVGIFDRMIAVHPDTQDEASDRYRKGVVLNEKLIQAEAALAEFNRALELNPDFLDAHYQKGSALASLSRWDEARKTLEELTGKEKRREELADALALLGRVIKTGFNDADMATSCYERALIEMPTHVASVQALGEVYEEIQNWPKFSETYQRFIKLIPPEESIKALPLHMKLGEVYRDKLSETNKSIIEFQHAIRIDQSHIPAYQALAKLFLTDPAFYPKALKVNKDLVRLQPEIPQPYHDMGKVYEENRDHDRSYVMYSILKLLGALDKTEKLYFEAYTEKAPLRPSKSIDDETWERGVLHPMARLPITEILSNFARALASAFETRPRPGERLPSSHAVSNIASELKSLIGIEDFELYIDNAPDAKPISFVNTDPVSIYFSASLIKELGPEGRRFIVAKALVMAKMGFDVVDGLDASEVKKRLRVVAKLYNSSVEVPDMPEKDASSLAKKLKKTIPRKIRKGVEASVERYISQENSIDVQSWKKGAEYTAGRAALIFVGNIPESFNALTKAASMTSGGRADADKNPLSPTSFDFGRELISFAATDPFFVLRKKVGMSIL